MNNSNILIIANDIFENDSKYSNRMIEYCKVLVNVAHVFMIPIRYDWSNNINEKKIKEIGVKLLFPRFNSTKYLLKFVLKNEIGTILFGSCNNIPEFSWILPFFETVIVDGMDTVSSKKKGIETVRNIEYLRKADIVVASSVTEKDAINKILPVKKIMVIPIDKNQRDSNKCNSCAVEQKILKLFDRSYGA